MYKRQLSDFIGSTSKLLDFVSKDPSKTYMVLTEPGIIHQMKKKEPNKIFIEVPDIEVRMNINPILQREIGTRKDKQ